MKKESSGILRFLYNTVPGRMVLKINYKPPQFQKLVGLIWIVGYQKFI